MKPYRIVAIAKAEKQIGRFPKDIATAIDRAIASLADDPRPHGCRKITGTDADYRIVVRKDYRVLYTIDDEARVVTVYHVGRREKDTYR
jgi:mRNA interferase RelE/StbE